MHFGVFIAFATLYPTAQIFFSIQARWIALALFAISALQYLAFSMRTSLLVLLLDSVAAVVTIQMLRGNWSFELRVPRKHPHLRVVEREKPVERGCSLPSIDSILEKISKSGMGSLTSKERAQLEKAREALLEKDRNH